MTKILLSWVYLRSGNYFKDSGRLLLIKYFFMRSGYTSLSKLIKGFLCNIRVYLAYAHRDKLLLLMTSFLLHRWRHATGFQPSLL